MIESFGGFLKKKRMPSGKLPEEVYDEHVDQIMHHMHEIHKLTHPTSLIHKALQRLGDNSSHVDELHDHIGKLLVKFGGR